MVPLMPELIMKVGDRGGERSRAQCVEASAREDESEPSEPRLVVEDAMALNGPHIRLLESLDMRHMAGHLGFGLPFSVRVGQRAMIHIRMKKWTGTSTCRRC